MRMQKLRDFALVYVTNLMERACVLAGERLAAESRAVAVSGSSAKTSVSSPASQPQPSETRRASGQGKSIPPPLVLQHSNQSSSGVKPQMNQPNARPAKPSKVGEYLQTHIRRDFFSKSIRRDSECQIIIISYT